MRKEWSLHVLITMLFVTLISCTKDHKRQINFTDPLKKCSDSPSDSMAITVYDSLNNVSFKLGRQWIIHFNDSSNTTECMDTVASDQFAQVRTFTITHKKNDLPLYDFFSEELTLMTSDSIDVIEIGRTQISNMPSFYVITKTTINGYSLNNTFFYVQYNKDVFTFQLGITESYRPIDEICKSLPLIDSITFDNYLNAKGMRAMLTKM